MKILKLNDFNKDELIKVIEKNQSLTLIRDLILVRMEFCSLKCKMISSHIVQKMKEYDNLSNKHNGKRLSAISKEDLALLTNYTNDISNLIKEKDKYENLYNQAVFSLKNI